MVYSQPHLLITVFGDAWTQTEEWQFGVRAGMNAIVDDAACQAIANTLAAPTQALLTNSDTDMTPNARLAGIKVARIGVDGKYPVDHAPGIYSYAPPVAGFGSGTSIPQVTLAVTLGTASPRGRASKGRFYLPPTTHAPAADGRIPTAIVETVADRAKTWVDAVNAVAEIDGVFVMSKLDAGTTRRVDKVGVGRVLDTMRSRRAKLPEERVYRALA
jgi:hypothetical protein